MVHIYRMYKFVKFVDKENEKKAAKVFSEFKEGKYDPSVPVLVSEPEISTLFSEKRVVFKKLSFGRTGQICRAAIKNGYLEVEVDVKKLNRLRVTHLRGLPFIDGVPFIRPGLWKAWYDEHGWLIAVFLGAIGLGIGHAIRFLWDIILNR